MADQKPYHLKNIDVENLDLSQHEKDFTPEELAAVKQALIATRNEHIANYEALPMLDKAGIYAQEKFGQANDYVSENPEKVILAPLAAIGAKAAIDKGREIFGSLREKMSSGAAPTFAQELATDQAAINQNKPIAQNFSSGKGITETERLAEEARILREELQRVKNDIENKYPSTTSPKTLEELQAEGKRLDAIHEARVKAAQTNLSAAPIPENPTVPLNTKVGKPPKEMPMIEQGLANKEINAIAEGRKQEALKPVEPPKTAPKAKIPMPEGWGKGMSWLVNQHGVEGAQDFIDRYNNGKPFESHNQMEARRQEVTIRPKFSDIPKSVRKERGITAAIVPPSPPSGGGMAVPPRTGAGGRLNETGRPGEEIIHNLNPLKL